MNIEVRLFATLRDFLPAGSTSPMVRLDLSPGASIADALAKLGIPADEVALTVVNGKFERDRQQPLSDGIVLSLWSHVAGG
jgi:sulfur carrier protein ThiS